MARRFLPSPSSAVRAVVVGDESHAEFGATVAALRAMAAVRGFSRVADALEWMQSGDERPIVDLIVLLQARPGEMVAEQVAQIQRATPLSRIVALAGSWCEGEPRSGRPLPGIERVYWYDWSFWLTREISPSRGTSPGKIGNTDGTGLATATLGIYTWRLVDYEALAAASKLCGAAASVWLDPRTIVAKGDGLSSISLLLWDGRYGDADELFAVQQIAKRFPGRPLVAIFSFPRFEAMAQARDWGISAILAKPLRIDDLHSALKLARGAAVTESSHRMDVA